MNDVKNIGFIVILTLLVLVPGVFIAGCVQDSGSSQSATAATTDSAVQETSQPHASAGIGSGTGTQDAGQHRNWTGNGTANATRPQIDLTSAAAKLGVSEQQLSDALGTGNTTGGSRWNLTQAAQTLGVSEDQLRSALNITAGRPGATYSPTAQQT